MCRTENRSGKGVRCGIIDKMLVCPSGSRSFLSGVHSQTQEVPAQTNRHKNFPGRVRGGNRGELRRRESRYPQKLSGEERWGLESFAVLENRFERSACDLENALQDEDGLGRTHPRVRQSWYDSKVCFCENERGENSTLTYHTPIETKYSFPY